MWTAYTVLQIVSGYNTKRRYMCDGGHFCLNLCRPRDQSSKYMHGTDDNVRFNLHSFWADHKKQLPLHYGVYLTEVGCIRAAAGSVKTIFSGAGKFTAEAPSSGATLLRMMVRNHENYQYFFIRPTIKAVVTRYNKVNHPNLGTAVAQPLARRSPLLLLLIFLLRTPRRPRCRHLAILLTCMDACSDV